MSGKLSSNMLDHPIFAIAGEAADQLGIEAYVVGGYVRDQCLGRRWTNFDIDFVCVGSGIEWAKRTASLISKDLSVQFFSRFGTAHFAWQGGDFEFVGARKESYKKDSRKPIVEDGSLEDDQWRRDFTINAMAICLNKERYGEFVDPFNGRQDLAQQVIRTPMDADQTFSDDPLRMLRAIRFATQLNFFIRPEVLEAIQRNVHRLEIISQERITTEVNKIILSSKPSVGFKLLLSTGLLESFFPEMVTLCGVETRDGKAHKDNFLHTLQVLDNVCQTSDDLFLRWSAILHDIAKPKTKRFDAKAGWTFHGHEVLGERMVKPIFKRFKLPLGEERKFVEKMVRLHLRPIPLSRNEISDSAIRRLLFDAGEDLESLFTLCEADITSKNKARVKRYMANFTLVRQKCIDIEAKDQVRNFQPPVTGEMIMETFGIGPCRAIGDIKSQIKEAILEGDIENDVEEAKALMIKLGADHGLTPVQ